MIGRMQPLKPETIAGEARELYDQVVGSPRAAGRGRSILIRDDGTLAGPFDAWLRTPEHGKHLEALGMSFRTDSVLGADVREVVILTVAAYWNVDFEFRVHAFVAQQAGVDSAVIHAIGNGKEPEFNSEQQTIAYQIVRELLIQRELNDYSYAAATELLTESGLVEVVTLTGFYQLVSGVLSAFDPPPPSVGLPEIQL